MSSCPSAGRVLQKRHGAAASSCKRIIAPACPGTWGSHALPVGGCCAAWLAAVDEGNPEGSTQAQQLPSMSARPKEVKPHPPLLLSSRVHCWVEQRRSDPGARELSPTLHVDRPDSQPQQLYCCHPTNCPHHLTQRPAPSLEERRARPKRCAGVSAQSTALSSQGTANTQQWAASLLPVWLCRSACPVQAGACCAESALEDPERAHQHNAQLVCPTWYVSPSHRAKGSAGAPLRMLPSQHAVRAGLSSTSWLEVGPEFSACRRAGHACAEPAAGRVQPKLQRMPPRSACMRALGDRPWSPLYPAPDQEMVTERLKCVQTPSRLGEQFMTSSSSSSYSSSSSACSALPSSTHHVGT